MKRLEIVTHYPAWMKKGGEKTYFPEKIISGIRKTFEPKKWLSYLENMKYYGYNLDWNVYGGCHSKSQTIRGDYEYYEKLEGKLIQPFIWSGKPRRSKHIVFCPPIRLKEVKRIEFKSMELFDSPNEPPAQVIREVLIDNVAVKSHEFKRFTLNSGFDSADDLFNWFDEDVTGALLKFGNK